LVAKGLQKDVWATARQDLTPSFYPAINATMYSGGGWSALLGFILYVSKMKL